MFRLVWESGPSRFIIICMIPAWSHNKLMREVSEIIGHFIYRKITAALTHYNDVIMGAMASQITNLTIVYATVYSDADQRKHQSSASLAFVRGIHRGPVNSPHKWPVTRKMVPFDDVIMSRKHAVCIKIFLVALTVDKRLGSTAAKPLTKFESDMIL